MGIAKMNGGQNELRNVVMMNMKRIQNIENAINQLSKHQQDNNKLLHIINEMNIKNNELDKIFLPEYFKDILNPTNTNFKDFLISPNANLEFRESFHLETLYD